MVQLEDLTSQLANAECYDEWIDLCKQLDVADNRVPWKMDDSSALYDYVKLHGLLLELRQARLQKDINKLLYLVRTTFARNVANLGDPRLFSYTHSGTKYLVDDFINECEMALEMLVTETDETQVSDVLNTLVQTRKAFGRTALVFSGGSILGFLHVGVARELIERNLLPRIISGSSAGSIFASMLCIHKDEEFDRMWELLKIPMSIFGPAGEEESLTSHFKRFCTVGTWIDSTYLREMMQGLIGDVTFQEAYNRTGRILNVTVSVAGSHDMPRLLNYLTAPNVVIWSAVVCSCSVPFFFAADSIFAKNLKTKEIYPWSKRAFIDGSVDNDMPLSRLSEMFNVNHFIASQVNPHIAPLFTNDRGSPDVQDAEVEQDVHERNGDSKVHDSTISWFSHTLTKGMKTGRSLLFNEVEHGLTMLKTAGITPSVASTMLNVIGQEYWGDVTIVPQLHWSDIGQLFKNPTSEKIEQFVLRGRKATWPKLALIHNHCAVEVALEKAIIDMRSRMIATVYSPIRVNGSKLNGFASKDAMLNGITSNGYANNHRTHSVSRPNLHHRQNSSMSKSKPQLESENLKSRSVTNLPSLRRSSSTFRTINQHSRRRRASIDVLYETISRRSSEI